MSRAAVTPTLPQNDTATEQAKRAAQIAATCVSYEWTTEVATLPGVPLATKVPDNDTPTLSWFLILIGVGLKIARNQLSIKVSSSAKGEIATPAATLAAAQARCDEIEASAARIHVQHVEHAATGILGRIAADLETGIDYVEHDAHLALLRQHASELREMIEMTDAERHGIGTGAPLSLDAYIALFDTLRAPGIAYQFQEDDVFARMRVAGPNSMLIKGIAALPDNFPLSDAAYAAIVNGDTLTNALAEGRIYLCDYVELDILAPGMWDGLPKYIYLPMALFAVPPGGSSLVPVAIQCGQDSSLHPIFTPSVIAGDAWGWEIAKLVVQVANGNYHELFAHLARTHLVMEAFAVATHRHLAEVHPIWALLVPHFEGLLFINNQAATTLIAAGGPIDHIFGGSIASSEKAAASDRLAFDFHGKMLPNDLAARNVADPGTLPDYPYRDDALLVWQAIHAWATQYVAIYYADDAAVTGDTELAAWAASLTSEGMVQGFKPIATRGHLADVCTMIIFTASAQHAAVNFPQKNLMDFAPAITGAGWAAAPTEQTGHGKQDWLGYMPPVALALEQLNTLYLLGSVLYRPLGTYLSNDFPYPAWFRDPAIIGADCALARFQAALQAVEARIVTRNGERKAPYPYLQPSLIPTSINI